MAHTTSRYLLWPRVCLLQAGVVQKRRYRSSSLLTHRPPSVYPTQCVGNNPGISKIKVLSCTTFDKFRLFFLSLFCCILCTYLATIPDEIKIIESASYRSIRVTEFKRSSVAFAKVVVRLWFQPSTQSHRLGRYCKVSPQKRKLTCLAAPHKN